MNTSKAVLSVILGTLAVFFRQYGLIIILVAVVITFDFASGILKSKIKGVINSKTGRQGFLKKLALFMALFFGIFMDYFIPMLLEAGVDLIIPFKLPFGLIVGCYIIINESISIIENLYECGVKMPAFIQKSLMAAKDKLDGADENKQEGGSG